MVCDSCFVKHRKCNREKPKCSRCVEFGIKCTWKRDKSNKKKEKFGNIILSLAKRTPATTQGNKNKYPETVKVLSLRQSKRPTEESYLTKFPILGNPVGVGDWNIIIKKWMSNLDAKLTFESVLKCVGISLEFLEPEERQFILELFLKKIQPVSIHSKVPIQMCHNSDNTQDDINAGYLNYFKHVNPFYPLFTFQQFLNRPRSHILQRAVCLIGLYYLPRTPIRDYLFHNFNQELTRMLVPSKLRFGLDTAQTILVYSIFLTTKSEAGKALGLCHMAGLMLNAMSYKNFHSDSCYELVLSKRIINNMECSFVINFYKYLSFDTLTQSSLKVRSSKENSCRIEVGKFRFNLSSSSSMTLKKSLVSLEKAITLIITNRKSVINHIYRDLCAYFFSKRCHGVDYELNLIQSSIVDLNKNYQETAVAINKLINTTITFYQKSAILDLKNDHFRYELMIRLNISSLLHEFKIFTCHLLNQIIELIPNHYYSTYRNSHYKSLNSIRKQALLYATHILNLFSQDNIDILVLQHARYIFFASRIIILHSAHYTKGPNYNQEMLDCCDRAVSMSKELLITLSTQVNNSYRENSFLTLLDFFIAESNSKRRIIQSNEMSL